MTNMLIHEVAVLVDEIQRCLRASASLRKGLATVVGLHEDLFDQFLDMIGAEDKKAPGHTAKIRSSVAGLVSALRKMDPIAVISASRDAALRFDRLAQVNSPLSDVAASLSSHISDFNHAYAAFLNAKGLQERQSSLKVLSLALRIEGAFQTIQTTERALAAIADARSDVTDDCELLLLRLEVPRDIAEIGRRLSALGELYQLCSDIVAVDVEEHPLLLERLEASSLWLTAIGKSVCVKLLKHLAGGAANAVRRHFTRQGRVDDLQQELTLAAAFDDFIQRQRESGADEATLERMSGVYRAAAPRITAAFRELYAGATSVQIDDAVYPLDGPRLLITTEGTRRLMDTNEYRAADRGHVWHWCPGCRFWPVENYRQAEGAIDQTKLCRFCSALDRQGRCDG